MQQINIGKAQSNDVVINDPSVSRTHLKIFIDDEQNVFITDLGSTNGTFVNGLRIDKPVKLETMDILLAGNTLIDWRRFLIAEDDLVDVYETLKDNNELLKVKTRLNLTGQSLKKNFFKRLFNVEVPLIISLVIFISSFFFPFYNESSFLGYQVLVDSFEVKLENTFYLILYYAPVLLIALNIFFSGRFSSKLKSLLLLLYLLVATIDFQDDHISRFLMGYWLWFISASFFMILSIYMKDSLVTVIKSRLVHKPISAENNLAPLYSPIIMTFIITLSILLNILSFNKTIALLIQNNVGLHIAKKYIGKDLFGQKKQKKQNTSVTYDFSCLANENDGGSSETIYTFGELTRSVQSVFFDDIDISVADEQDAGRDFLNQIESEFQLITTGADIQNLRSIVNDLTSRLAKPRGFEYKIYLVNDPMLNAITSGGHIVFFKGLYDFCKNKSELAAVISHEIAHNELGHLTLGLKKQKAASDWGLLGEIVLKIENELTQSFNQKQETEADLFGMDIVVPTLFSNCASIDLWNRMSTQESDYDMVDNFFRSHPYSRSRTKCIERHLVSNYNNNCN